MKDYLDVPALVRLGVVRSRFAAYRAVKNGDLPKPAVVAGKFIWLKRELDQHLTGRRTGA